ncbi:hypothetical protein DXG03_002507 [Asterophora parasitica]|uniref:ubiquitinyl hydrolase 1 n=1 Tax=Asterophora parasitica TaxID=117018 RepID=A0A9P7G2B3_9AGAR|nr:hypothetical protein DXG03_002507 [Asterophora parasitica]
MSCEHEYGSQPIPPSDIRGRHSFPHNILFRTADWTSTSIPEDAERYNVIVAFSISKWIHLNGGDDALKAFFQRVYSVLEPGGKFVFEPQAWGTYGKAKRMDEARILRVGISAYPLTIHFFQRLRDNAKKLQIRPEDFGAILAEIGFGPAQHFGITGEGGFRRPVDLIIGMQIWSDRHHEGVILHFDEAPEESSGRNITPRQAIVREMAKAKTLTPQEMYRARKQREEQEKAAFLPSGLINHGNTCFMNSVLQGHSSPAYAPASWRSPLLTNAHKLGGQYDQPWVDTMPIGDVFLDLMVRAWDSQSLHMRQSLSPKPILGALGRKYEQYLDFAQQDAHEFLRILLDATRMEELDVIKRRQPPPMNIKMRRRQTITPSYPPSEPPPIPEEDKLLTLADMIFGGRFASILVCQKCKNVSQTYEDFNDISLSIKAEDYQERKRDRLKNLAKRLTTFPNPNLNVAHDVPRPSSVPPAPNARESPLGGHEEPPTVDDRRRSLDIVAEGQAARSDPNVTTSSDNAVPVVITNGNGIGAGDIKHIELPPTKEKREKKDDSWTKLGRRISMTVGLGKSSKERRSRSRERNSKDYSRTSLQVDPSSSSENTTESGTSTRSTPRSSASDFAHSSTPAIHLSSGFSTPPTAIDGHIDPTLSPRTPSPTPIAAHRMSLSSRRHQTIRGKSPKPPKPSAGEIHYLREILADITPASSGHPFALFQPNTSNRSVVGHGAAVQNLWLSMNHFSGIEECLRMFTSVEILDGENMVGCRRCWKIANGKYEAHPGSLEERNEDEDSDSVDSHPPSTAPIIPNGIANPKPQHPPPSLSPLCPAALSNIPTSMSTPTVQLYTLTNNSDDRSIASLSTTEASSIQESDADSAPSVKLVANSRPSTPGGLPIPSISTTGPESPAESRHPTSMNGVWPLPPLIDRSASLPPPSNPSSPINPSMPPIVQPAPRLGQVLNHLPSANHTTSYSLPIPKTRQRRTTIRPVLDPEESSEAESDASAATSTRSMESSTSASHAPSTATTTPTARKKPKPVIMRPAYKRYLIGTPPPVLVIHLKRFQQVNKMHMLSFSHGFKKLDDFVTFPELLDLTPYLAPKKEDFGLGKKAKRGFSEKGKEKEKCMYRLYAVVVHIGNMLGGHYIAYTALPDPGPVSGAELKPEVSASSTDLKARSQRQWAYISDTIVRLTTLEEVLKAKAYICMYERVGS